MMHADAAMGQPLGNPYTKPAMVLAVEYPIMGGTEVTKMSIKAISQPPGISRHDFDTVASQAKKASEYKMDKMINVHPSKMTKTTSDRCRTESFQNAAYIFSLHLRYIVHWSRTQPCAPDDIRWDREMLPERRWLASLRDQRCGCGNRVSDEDNGGVSDEGEDGVGETLSALGGWYWSAILVILAWGSAYLALLFSWSF